MVCQIFTWYSLTLIKFNICLNCFYKINYRNFYSNFYKKNLALWWWYTLSQMLEVFQRRESHWCTKLCELPRKILEIWNLQHIYGVWMKKIKFFYISSCFRPLSGFPFLYIASWFSEEILQNGMYQI